MSMMEVHDLGKKKLVILKVPVGHLSDKKARAYMEEIKENMKHILEDSMDCDYKLAIFGIRDSDSSFFAS